MAEEHYHIVFNGEIVAGKEQTEVKKKLAGLFKVGEDKIDRLFSDCPVVIKKGLDKKTAMKYKAAFEKAGAICKLERSGEPIRKIPAENESQEATTEANTTRCPKCGYQPKRPDDPLIIRGECPQCKKVAEKSLKLQEPTNTSHVNMARPVVNFNTERYSKITSKYRTKDQSILMRFVTEIWEEWNRFNNSIEEILPLGIWRVGKWIVLVFGLIVIVSSGTSFFQPDYEILYKRMPHQVRCGHFGDENLCHVKYLLWVGNTGSEMQQEVHFLFDANIVGDMNNLFEASPPGSLTYALMESYSQAGRKLRSAKMEAASSSYAMKEPRHSDSQAHASYEEEFTQQLDELISSGDIQLQIFSPYSGNPVKTRHSTRLEYESIDIKDGLLIYTLGNFKPGKAPINIRIDLSLKKDTIYSWDDILLGIEANQGDVREGDPHLGILGRLFFSFGF